MITIFTRIMHVLVTLEMTILDMVALTLIFCLALEVFLVLMDKYMLEVMILITIIIIMLTNIAAIHITIGVLGILEWIISGMILVKTTLTATTMELSIADLTRGS